MNRLKIPCLVLFAAVLLLAVFIKVPSAHASGDFSGWGTAPNIGNISLNSTDPGTGDGGVGTSAHSYKVFMATTTGDPTIGYLGGYAWSSSIGWIKFGASTPGGADVLTGMPIGGDTNVAKVNLLTGAVTGFIRACAGTQNGDCSNMTSRTDGWDGWIELSGVKHSTDGSDGNGTHWNTVTGAFSGYAWGSDVVGWVLLDSGCSSCVLSTSAPTCNVTATPNSVVSGGNTTLSWSSANATSCRGTLGFTGASLATSGSVSTTTAATMDYDLSCSNLANPTPALCSSATVTVSSAPSASLNIGASATDNHATLSVAQGDSFFLNYSTANLNQNGSCTLSSSEPIFSTVLPIGSLTDDGSQSFNSTVLSVGTPYHFSLACSNPSGPAVTTQNVTLNITTPAYPPLTGSCTPNLTPVTIGSSVSFALAVTGGTNTYTYTLLPDNNNAVTGISSVPYFSNTPYIYTMVGSMSPHVVVTDTNSHQTTNLACGTGVTVTSSGADAGMFIGDTSSHLHVGPYTMHVVKGNPFYMRWYIVDPDGAYACTKSINAPTPAALVASGWDTIFAGLAASPTTARMFATNSAGLVYGSYTFALHCQSADPVAHPPANYPVINSSVILDLTNSHGGQF